VFLLWLVVLGAIALFGGLIAIAPWIDPEIEDSLVSKIFVTIICLGFVFVGVWFLRRHIGKRGRDGTFRIGGDTILLAGVSRVGICLTEHGFTPLPLHAPVLLTRSGEDQRMLLELAMYNFRSKPTKGSIRRAKRLAKLLGTTYLGLVGDEFEG